MKKALAELHTEPFTTEREWTVDGIPVLTASVSVPRPVPAADSTGMPSTSHSRSAPKGSVCSCVRCWLMRRRSLPKESRLQQRMTGGENG